MTLYIGINRDTGQAITETDHPRHSVRDILLTPQGSRLARRVYGSLLSALIDQPQNPVLRLQIMAAVYVALQRWEQEKKETAQVKRRRKTTKPKSQKQSRGIT
ncbi:TPA: GPW/gp25 family protein [Klebsiella michiganensis]|nr:hypothetical protein [Klebsiella michiganensis]QLW90572.1 GPW/gp25 family protein [Klebsiella oxytoca]SBL44928.1 baseplate assembly protein W [Klebsiella michiganensis]STV92465.1 baseplate assembly protein W [Klebsiella michiganensis]HBM2898401.1 GPW/gp25 family protein [Klebsiella michiganensis]